MSEWSLPLDGSGRETVRAYLEQIATKPATDQQAFNEGVMCAAFAMGAVIDGMDSGNPARSTLERAYNAAIRMRLPRPIDQAA